MKKIVYMFVLVVGCLMFASCSLFTTSLGTAFARDSDKMFNKATTAELVDFATDSGAADSDVAAGILDELSKRENELSVLEVEDKEDILQLAVDATIPMGAIAGVLADVDMNNMENLDAGSIVNDIFDAIPEFDTAALDALLSDRDTLENADVSVLADAAIVSLVQVVEEDGIKNIMDNIDNINVTNDLDATVESIAAAARIDASEKAELKNTVKVLQLLTGSKVDGINRTVNSADVTVLGMLSLSDFGF